jgi:hypothetical protein
MIPTRVHGAVAERQRMVWYSNRVALTLLLMSVAFRGAHSQVEVPRPPAEIPKAEARPESRGGEPAAEPMKGFESARHIRGPIHVNNGGPEAKRSAEEGTADKTGEKAERGEAEQHDADGSSGGGPGATTSSSRTEVAVVVLSAIIVLGLLAVRRRKKSDES